MGQSEENGKTDFVKYSAEEETHHVRPSKSENQRRDESPLGGKEESLITTHAGTRKATWSDPSGLFAWSGSFSGSQCGSERAIALAWQVKSALWNIQNNMRRRRHR
jgi:hypothetical protein